MMRSVCQTGERRARHTSLLRQASPLGAVVLTSAGCQEDIIEPPTVQALVYGTATVAGQGVAGRSVVASGFEPSCQRPNAVGGEGETDASGIYRIVLAGSAVTNPICVRVGLVSASGTDTVFAFGTVEAQRTPPYDSVRISVNRATP